MEFKGTKEKWITENFDLKGYEKSILILSKNDNKQIAEVNFEYLRNNDYVYNALLISKSPILLQAIYDSIEPLKKAGLKEMADYHEKIYLETLNL